MAGRGVRSHPCEVFDVAGEKHSFCISHDVGKPYICGINNQKQIKMNIVTLSGRVGRDAEARQAGERWVVKFTLATDRRANVNGQWVSVADWHNVELWGSSSKAAEFLKKGTQVTVSGSLRYDEYEGKDGVKRRAAVVAGNMNGGLDIHFQKRTEVQPGQTVQEGQPQMMSPHEFAAETLGSDLPF